MVILDNNRPECRCQSNNKPAFRYPNTVPETGRFDFFWNLFRYQNGDFSFDGSQISFQFINPFTVPFGIFRLPENCSAAISLPVPDFLNYVGASYAFFNGFYLISRKSCI